MHIFLRRPSAPQRCFSGRLGADRAPKMRPMTHRLRRCWTRCSAMPDPEQLKKMQETVDAAMKDNPQVTDTFHSVISCLDFCYEVPRKDEPNGRSDEGPSSAAAGEGDRCLHAERRSERCHTHNEWLTSYSPSLVFRPEHGFKRCVMIQN